MFAVLGITPLKFLAPSSRGDRECLFPRLSGIFIINNTFSSTMCQELSLPLWVWVRIFREFTGGLYTHAGPGDAVAAGGGGGAGRLPGALRGGGSWKRYLVRSRRSEAGSALPEDSEGSVSEYQFSL